MAKRESEGLIGIENMRSEYEKRQQALADEVGRIYPLGRRCAILRRRKGESYRIYGIIYGAPCAWASPTRLSVKTDSRGTIMQADYHDIELL
jgi:hypothetical protein